MKMTCAAKDGLHLPFCCLEDAEIDIDNDVRGLRRVTPAFFAALKMLTVA